MYDPRPEEEGYALLKNAVRDYLLADLSEYGLPSVTALLNGGVSGIIDEGSFTETTPTPVIIFSTLGDGGVKSGGYSIARLILYVVDRGRGLLEVERIVDRIRRRLNAKDDGKRLALSWLTFTPGSTPLRVEDIEASGSSATMTLPAWRAEGHGLYVFLTVSGWL